MPGTRVTRALTKLERRMRPPLSNATKRDPFMGIIMDVLGGNVAIGEAMRYVRDGWADVMVAGATEVPSRLVPSSSARLRLFPQ
jgi:hypothetical protein